MGLEPIRLISLQKGAFRPRESHSQREGSMKVQGEGAHAGRVGGSRTLEGPGRHRRHRRHRRQSCDLDRKLRSVALGVPALPEPPPPSHL